MGNKLPECPNYVAHPQSVWFNEHWRPVIEQLKAENERLFTNLINFQIEHPYYKLSKALEEENNALKSKIKISRETLTNLKSWGYQSQWEIIDKALLEIGEV